MRYSRSLRRTVPAIAVLVLLVASTAAARGKALDGRKAPALTFHQGVNGVGAGGRLRDFRGKVVWLKFVLRECGSCRRAYPAFQALHERWGGSGLVTLAVMHRQPAKTVEKYFRERGYTFPVAIDSDGKEAQRYGVGRRPTDYVIGHDGVVRSSNGAPERVIRVELAKRRVARLGEVPKSLAAVKDDVWNWDYGAALRRTEPALEAEEVPEAVTTFGTRLRDEARAEIDARLGAARRLRSGRRVPEARALLDRIAKHFKGTSLHAPIVAERALILAVKGPEKR